MNIIRKQYAMIFLFVTCWMLVGCSKPIASDAPVPLTWETVNERVQNGSMIADYEKTVNNGITYYFESGIYDEENRRGFIADIDAFCHKVWESQTDMVSENNRITVYVGDFLTTQGTAGKAFIQTQDIASYRGMTAVLMSMMAETVNYGQAYGIAAVLSRELGLAAFSGQPLYSDDELAAIYEQPENLCLLDFFLPAFEPLYVGEISTAYVKAGAESFAAYYIQKAGLENALRVCRQSAHPETGMTLAEEKNEWLMEIGANIAYQPSPYVIPFVRNLSDNRVTYPYLVHTDSAEWYLSLADVQGMGYADFIAGFAETLTVQEPDFSQARTVLQDWIDSDIPAVRIYTDFEDKSETSRFLGAFYSQGNYIKLFHSWQQAQYNLLHEYVHYLTIKHAKNKAASGFWGEGIAEEVAVWECENRLADLFWKKVTTEEEAKRLKQFHMWDDGKETVNARLQQMCEAACMYLGYGDGWEYLSIGQELLTSSADRAESIRPGQLSYSEAAGMMAYLMEEYGRDMVYANCHDSNRIHTAFDKPFPELYDAWGKWNIRQCEEAGIDMEALGKYISEE